MINKTDNSSIITTNKSKDADNLFINGSITSNGTSISKIALLDRKYRPEEWVLWFKNNSATISYKSVLSWTDITCSFSFDTTNTAPVIPPPPTPSNSFTWHTLDMTYNNSESLFIGYFKVDTNTNIIESFYDASYNNILLKNEELCDNKYINNNFTSYGVCISKISKLSQYPATKWAIWTITIDGNTTTYLAYKRNPWVTVEDLNNITIGFNEIEKPAEIDETPPTPPPPSCVCILSQPLPPEKPQKNHSQESSRQRWARIIQSSSSNAKPNKNPLPNRYVLGLASGIWRPKKDPKLDEDPYTYTKYV